MSRQVGGAKLTLHLCVMVENWEEYLSCEGFPWRSERIPASCFSPQPEVLAPGKGDPMTYSCEITVGILTI